MIRRNILLVAGVFPPGIGGMQNYYYNLCRYSRHNVTVLASRYEGDEEFDAKQSFRIVRKPFLTDEKISVPHILRLYSQIKRIIKQDAIEVTVYGYIMFGLIGLLLNLFQGRKYVVAVHGLDVLMLTRFFLLRGLVKMILNRADSVMVNSGYTKKLMMELGVGEDRIEIVYPGVEEQFERAAKDPDMVTRYGLEGKYVLMTLGRLVQRKGFDMMIRSMPEIRKKIPEAVYLIVGGGPEREALEKLARELGVEDAVIFAGRVADDEMVKCYNLCDVFVMPSRYMEDRGDVEGFGIVFMEAASCYKPVIGGNSGGVVEAVLDGETGILVDPKSTTSISQAVLRLYTNPDQAELMAARGYHRAKTQFHYRAIAKGYDAFLTSVAAHKGKRRLFAAYRKTKTSP